MHSAEAFLQKHQLLNKEESVLVAVSGGIDSISLAHFLHSTGYKIGLAHVNYQLRGAESDRDMELVEAFAKDRNIPFHSTMKSKPDSASVQTWARNVRYEYFNDLCSEFGYKRIATAHHADDSLETMLINLSRGTGIHGLSGIPKLRGNIARPFLETTRKEITAYAEQHDLQFSKDGSNESSDYLRNLFRNEILPTLENFDPAVLTKLSASNKNLKEDALAINILCAQFATTDSTNTVVDLNDIPTEGRGIILYHCLRKFGYNRSQCQDMIDALSGSIFESEDHIATKKGTVISVTTQENTPQSIDITTEGIFRAKGHTLSVAKHAYLPEKLPKKPNHIWADSAAVNFPLSWKTIEKGARFQPLGATYSVDVFDYLKDAGFDQTSRKRVMAIFDATQKLIWIPGLQLSDHAKCKPETTRVLSLNISSE